MLPKKGRGRGRGRGISPSQYSNYGDQRSPREPGHQAPSTTSPSGFFPTTPPVKDVPSNQEPAELGSCGPKQKRKTRNVDPEEIGIELIHNKQNSRPLATRPGFGKLGRRKIELISNCFPIVVPSGSVYHYDVEIIQISPNSQHQAVEVRENIPRYRCLNTKKHRKIIELMLETNSNFEDMYAAYDGEKNLYTRKELNFDFPLKCEVILPNEHESESENVWQEVFEVAIKPVKKDNTQSCAISLDALHAFYNKTIDAVPLETIMAIEAIFRHGPCLRFTPIGSYFFSSKSKNLHPLGGGLEVWYGYHQSVRISQWGPTVVLNTAATTFWQEGPVLNYVADFLRLGSVEELAKIALLSDADIKFLSKKLENRKCRAIHLNHTKCILKLTRGNAHDVIFPFTDNGIKRQISVFQYFKERYNIDLKFPNLPCVQVKAGDKQVYFPIELCNIVAGQHAKTELTTFQKNQMIKFTVFPPDKKMKEIERIRNQEANYDHDRSMQEFEINVSHEPLHVEGRILDAPNLVYKNNKTVCPHSGSWNMRGLQFLESAHIKRWILLNFEYRLGDSFIDNFVQEILKQGKNLGTSIENPINIDRIRNHSNVEQLLRRVQQNADLAIIILPSLNETALYGEIKRVSEILIGLTTQCIKAETVKKLKGKGGPQIVGNLWLKINEKMGGQNNELHINDIPGILKDSSMLLWKPIIIIGADVNHPPPSNKRDRHPPSLAACVGSLTSKLVRFAVSIRPQRNENKKKKTVEEIVNLQEMVRELLMAFYRSTNKMKPEKIIFYRDGVSEGQFLIVRDHEVNCIRKACTSLEGEYKPGLTFVVVQKRHHVRFVPNDPRDGEQNAGNAPPGTVNDTDVTHPVNFDFYLGSQKAVKGTSRFSHYTVIEDDNNFSADDIQKFTYHLCYLYVRCTKSVSVPAPVAYAHLVAKRARRHLDAKLAADGGSTNGSEDGIEGDDSLPLPPDIFESVQILHALKDSMYFV